MLPSSKFQISLLVLLQLVCLWGGGTAYTVRHVNWNTGHDNSTCRIGSIPCKTLAYALEELDSDTTVLLDDEEVNHLSTSTVQGPISNIIINGSHGNTVINCSKESGFSFTNVTALTIANVEFHACGALHNSTSYDRQGRSTPYMMSVYFYNCCDVSLLSTNVSYSPGAGVVMLAVRGHVNVMDSTFFRNGFQIPHNGSFINETVLIGRLAGGGLKIELPSCPPGVNSVDCNGNNDVCPPEGSSLPEYTDIAYNIENCSFISNTADVPKFNTDEYDDPETGYFTTIGRGGGISIVIKGVSRKIQVTVTSCHFEDNWSLFGAGLFMELWHRPDNVSMNTTSSTFIHNHVPYNLMWDIGTGGGGFMYTHRYCPLNPHEGNSLLISGCNFTGNKAYWGGGVSLVLLPQQSSLKGDMVLFQSSSFVGNVARIGAAIDFYRNSGATVPPQAILQDVQFADNTVKYADEQSYINGEGIVYVDSTVLYVKSSLNVFSNQGNGISSLYGTIHFLDNSTSLFYANQAYRGAALALYGNAAIVLYNGSQLNFTENKVDTVGGAIYHAALGNRAIPFSGSCPIQLAHDAIDWNETSVTVHFINNEAAQGTRGTSIYVSSFLPCVQRSLNELNDTFKWRPFHYECDSVKNPNCTDLQVSGDGSIVKPTKNGTLSMIAFPGEHAPLPFTVEDDQRNEVDIHFQGEVHDNTSAYPVDILNGRNVFITGLPKKNVTLELHSTESQTLSVSVRLNITECPPGFLLENTSEGVCQCASRDSLAYVGMRCDQNDMTFKLAPNFWVGYLMVDNDSDTSASIGFRTGHCPTGYCGSQSITLNGSDHYDDNSLDEIMCGPQNRTGVLCANCKVGYGLSVLLNEQFQCVPCNNTSPADGFKAVILWLLAEFVPFNLLFILFIVFNVNILSGWGGVLYGLVFYFQIVPSTPAFQYRALSSTDDVTAVDWYGWSLYVNALLSNFWNLEFFSAFIPLRNACMSTTTTVQGAILVTYLLILVWPLIVYSCLIAIHRCYRHGYCCRPAHMCLFRIGKFLAKCQHSEEGGVNSLAGLCSFFVLVYTKLVILTWRICGNSLIVNSNGDPEIRRVFLYNGTVPWFDPTLHAPYAVPIVVCSIVSVLIPTLLLVSFPLVPKLLVKLNLHEHRPFRWIISLLSTSYLQFLFDIFQGCFRPNVRSFAALYLIYRHLFVFVWSFLSWFAMSYGVYQSVFGVTFIMFHLVAQPFASNAVNRITGMVMVNLTLVIILSQWIILLEQEFEQSANSLSIKAIVIVLLYLPQLLVVILFTWVITRHIYQRITQSCAPKRSIRQGSYGGQQLEESGRHSNIDDWDAVRYLCDRTAVGWEGSQGNEDGTGYVQLEEEEEEGEGEIADRLGEQLHIQTRRHTTSTSRKVHSGYGSLADNSKTQ